VAADFACFVLCEGDDAALDSFSTECHADDEAVTAADDSLLNALTLAFTRPTLNASDLTEQSVVVRFLQHHIVQAMWPPLEQQQQLPAPQQQQQQHSSSNEF